MLYDDYMRKAVKETIVNEDGNIYLMPNYRQILRNIELTPDKVTDETITIEEVAEYLKLEVERLKEIGTKREAVYEWLYDLFTTTVEPAILDQENDLMKNMLEYMRLNEELKTKEEELNTKEEELTAKEEMPLDVSGFSFSKKKPGE